MKYVIRNEILPVYFQIGYIYLNNGVSIGKKNMLSSQPIVALHFHHCLEFGICLSGSGEAHIENRIYQFKQGDIQCVSANTPHMSVAYENEPCSWIWIFVDVPALLSSEEGTISDTLLEIANSGFNGVFSPYEHPDLARLINSLAEVSLDDEFSELYSSLLIGQILIESARIGNIDKGEKRLAISKKIKPALIYIRDNYSNPQLMSAKNIASTCGMSVSHFRRLFKDDVGMSLPQYIAQTRLSHVAHLLQTTDKKIIQIASDVGFYEITYFNKLFHDTFGMSPREMRKRYQDTI